MNKAMRKAIMARSRFKNIYLKIRNTKNRENYDKQRNFCTNLLTKKNEYFCDLNINNLDNNKMFWTKKKRIC